MNTNDQTKRTRSPNFPYSTLRKSVELTRKLWGDVKKTQFPVDIAMKKMNLSPKSSVSNRVISSMISYGLLDEEGTMKNKRIGVSELGRRISVDDRPNNPQRLKELQTAALNDPMMKKVWDFWQRGLPRNEKDIKTDLEKDFGFQSEAAGRFARVILENYEFAQLDEYDDYEPSSSNSEQMEEAPNDDESIAKIRTALKKSTPENLASFKGYTLSLGRNKEVKLYTSNALTQADIEFMIQWINRLDLKREEEVENDEEQA